MTAKYVVITSMGLEAPVLVPEERGLMHRDIVPARQQAVAAGFCQRQPDGRWHAWGGSVSLGLMSRPLVDAKLIEECYERVQK